jgi:hypothetical protein
MSWASDFLHWIGQGFGGSNSGTLQQSRMLPGRGVGGGIPGSYGGGSGFMSTQPVNPTFKLPDTGNSSGFLGLSGSDWGTILQGIGTGWNIYSGIQNQKNANAKTSHINNLAGAFLQNPNQNIQSILQRINPGQDSLMQFLRADPSRTFDTSTAFGQLEANDNRQINNQASALRAGYSGLGQRFGTSAQRNEGRMRSDFASQIAARNAGLAQSSFESSQGRSMQAAQLLSQLSSGIYQQSGNQNAQLLAIMAGLPPQGSLATPIGTGMQDLGQLLQFLPLIRQLGGGNA